MSIENPFSSMWGWKVDPDNRQNRASGPCTIRQMTSEEKIKYGIAVEGEDDMKITKAAVREMAASGMSNNDIAEHFLPHYPKMTKGRMMAKVSALLSDKAGRPAKEKIDAKGVKRICPDCVPAKCESCDGIPEECVGDQEELKITEVAERVKDEVSKATRDSMEKIKLSQAVDEMMELVPDNINHPAHYTTGKIEVIDYLQEKMSADMFEGFCVGNALKYLSRYRHKGGLEDLKKAEWYLNKIITVMETA